MQKIAPEKQTANLPSSDVSFWTYNPTGTQTIVMIHGFRGDHHGLEDIIAELPATCRIIVPDLPGFGESRPLKKLTHDIAGYTQFLHEFIAHFNFKKPPVLLGHSFGSIITTHFAAEYPKMIEKLILVNPIASPALKGPRAFFSQLTVFYYWLGSKLPETAGRALLGNKAIVLSMSTLLVKTKDKAIRRRIHKKHLTHFSTFQSRQVVLESFKASVSNTAQDKAGYVTTPTLLIAGEMDDIAPVDGQKKLASAINSQQLVIIPGVGHLLHHEAPRDTARTIAAFCQKS